MSPTSWLKNYGILKGMMKNRSSTSIWLHLGIVADIALLKGDTRYLLQLGLDALRHTKRPGLLAMMELTELNQVQPDRRTYRFRPGATHERSWATG